MSNSRHQLKKGRNIYFLVMELSLFKKTKKKNPHTLSINENSERSDKTGGRE